MYPSNMVRHYGKLMLCDLDTLRSGPAEVDLACVEVHCRRVLGGDAWEQFLAGYALPYDPELVRCLAGAKELAYIQWPLHLQTVGAQRDRHKMVAEYTYRVDTADHPDVLWVDL